LFAAAMAGFLDGRFNALEVGDSLRRAAGVTAALKPQAGLDGSAQEAVGFSTLRHAGNLSPMVALVNPDTALTPITSAA
jgi:hypothetical protein